MEETLAVVSILAQRLEALQIPYYVGGSLASSLHGVFRATNDADIVVPLKPEQVEDLVAALEVDFYVDGDMIRTALQHNLSFNVIYLPTMVKADLFPSRPGAFGETELSRRRGEIIEGEESSQTIFFASPEDIVLQKLLWYRATGERSDRQWGDVQGVLKVQAGALDLSYLSLWSHELEIADLLAQAADDAGLTLPTND